MLHFHCLVVPVGLARLWIPACAGMTMKAKAAGMVGSCGKSPDLGLQSGSTMQPSILMHHGVSLVLLCLYPFANARGWLRHG
jgi:hypothetical protein